MWSERLARAWVLAVACAFLAACTTVGPDFARPTPPTQTGYAMAGDRVAEPKIVAGQGSAGVWWRAFASPELDATIRQALADNDTLASADAALAQAQESVRVARSARRPQLDVQAGASREQANLKAFGLDFGIPNPQFSLYSLGGAVSYDLDLFGGRRRALEGARASVEAQAHRRDAAYLMLTGNVARQALTIAALRAQIAAVEQVATEDRRTLSLVQRAYAAGGVAREQTVDAANALDLDLAQLPPLQEQLEAARHQLAILVGRAPAAWRAPDFDIAAIRLPAAPPLSLPSELVRRRPDILAAQANLHAATAQIGVRTAALYPSVTLNASVTLSALSPQDILSPAFRAWSLGAGLTAPLFHGGRLSAERRAAVDAADASLADYKQTVLTAFVQVADALSALAHDAERVAAAERASASAQESVRLARLAYTLGGRDLLQLIDAQRRASRTRIELVQAQAQQYLDTVQLAVAAAGNWTDPPP